MDEEAVLLQLAAGRKESKISLLRCIAPLVSRPTQGTALELQMS